MANDANKGQTPAATGKKPRVKKQPSAKRVAAENAVAEAQKRMDAAKSPQEKTVAESALKAVRDELKALRFIEVGQPRIRSALNVLRKLENVANRNAYKWTDEQAGKAVKALTDSMKRVTDKLLGNKDKAEADKFTF